MTMRLRRSLPYFLAAFLTFFLLSSCSSPKVYVSEYSDLLHTLPDTIPSIKGDRSPYGEFYDNATLTDILRNQKGIEGLVYHEIRQKDNQIQADFYFSDEINRDSISNIRAYMASRFMSDFSYSVDSVYSPFDGLAVQDQKFDTVYVRTFYRGYILTQDSLEDGVVKYYENVDKTFNFRKASHHQAMDVFREEMLRSFNFTDITYERSLNEYVLIIRGRTSKDLSGAKIDQIKPLVQVQLANELYVEGYAMYQGIVLHIEDENGIAYAETFFINIPGSRKWMDENWMNYDFHGKLIEQNDADF